MFVLAKSGRSSKMVYVRSKTRSLGQMLEKPCVGSRGHIFSPMIMKMVRMFDLMRSHFSMKMGHVGSESRSPGQILEKPFLCSRGHIFSPIIRKLGQNVCLDEVSDEFENGSCWVKN